MDQYDQFFNNPKTWIKYLGGSAFVFFLIVLASSGTFTIQPGNRGLLITLGKVAPVAAPEGFGFKMPFITSVLPISVRQQTKSLKDECFSSDLQQVRVDLRVLYRIPENMVVKIFQNYAGDPFDSLISPRV